MINAIRKYFSRPDVAMYPGQLLDASYHDILEAARFSPDHHKLINQQWANVFIYDNCQKGQSKFNKLGIYNDDPQYSEVHRLAAGLTQSDGFVMMKKPLGKETFPFALKVEPEQLMGLHTNLPGSLIGTPARVSGTLFSVRPYRLFELDKHVLNTVYFNRERVIIDVRYRKRDDKTGKLFGDMITQKMPAWMYVARPEFFLPELNRYKPVTLYEANARQSDGFTREHYYFYNERVENCYSSAAMSEDARMRQL